MASAPWHTLVGAALVGVGVGTAVGAAVGKLVGALVGAALPIGPIEQPYPWPL